MPGRNDDLPPEIPDEALVAQVSAGDIAAFDQLIRRYQEKLYSMIYNMTSNHEDTNDLLMEVFDRAFRNMKSFKGESSFYTWIYRIALNRTLNHLGKRKRTGNHMSLNEIDMEDALQAELLDPSSGVNPEKQSELNELQIKLNESLQKLSDQHRTVVVLFDIEGMTHAEISKLLHVSEGTVRSRLHYAHKQLQKYLSGFMNAKA